MKRLTSQRALERRRMRSLVLPMMIAVAACSESTRPAASPSWTVAGTPTLQIGEQDGDARYLFDRITAVRLLPGGGVVVADRGRAAVSVYGGEGTHVATMGREGQGPGEFEWISYLGVLAPDTILVYDSSLYRATRFLLDGTFVDSRPIRPEGGAPEVYVGTYANGDAAVASLVPPPRGGTSVISDPMALARIGPEGTLVEELGVVDGIRRVGGMSPVPFSPFLHAHLLRDSVVHTDGREPVLWVLGAGGSVARSIPVPLPAPDPADAWRTLQAELESRDLTSWIADLPPEAEAEPVPAISEFLVDRAGNFWLKRYEPRTDATHLRKEPLAGGRWTVVAPDGQVVGEVEVPNSFAPLDVSMDRVAGVHRDELGVERVFVYERQR